MKSRSVILIWCSLFMVACAANEPIAPRSEMVQAELRFVDLRGFDRDLAASLAAPLPRVEVSFYDRVTPSALPERLQHWLAAVEDGGGTLKVVPAKPTLTAKSPLLLIGAVGTLWSAVKMVRDLSDKARFKPAESFDAELLLKLDDRGDSVVDKVIFVQRQP